MTADKFSLIFVLIPFPIMLIPVQNLVVCGLVFQSDTLILSSGFNKTNVRAYLMIVYEFGERGKRNSYHILA